MYRRWLVVFLALLLVALGLWTGPGGATQANKVKIGMPTTQPNVDHITPWVAKAKGF